jgi:sialate O-acetylesterase
LQIKDHYGYLKGFAIAGADGNYHWVQARLAKNIISVYSEDVARPIAVRYNWGNSPDGNLYNAEGLPAVPFEAYIKSE